MKKFVTLGTECAEYLKATKASEGTLFPLVCLPQAPFLASLSYSFFPIFTIDALATANARISSLEAELEASRRAFDTATVAKTNAEKASKSALDKAKKMEKSLADLKKERTQRDQAVALRLNKMSALAGGKHHAFFFSFVWVACSCAPLMCLCFLDCIEHTGIPSASAQLDDDSLMAAVSLLEANWISIQGIFELASRVLTRISIGLWPKQRADIENSDLKKLVKAFDTSEDPILLLKGRSIKRGAEGAIALAYAHGEEVDWEKVSSFRSWPLSELRGFFERAKKYAPGIVSIISPSVASLTSAPASSTPSSGATMHPPGAAATSMLPAPEQDAEVA
jgi:hypothetical protein